MEQNLALTCRNQASGMVKPKIEGNVNFEIKSQFMRELREDTFSGNKIDDAYEHVERILDILNLFNILGVTHDAVMLCVFPITLTRVAKRWVDRLSPGIINTQDLLIKAFIQRYCSPFKTTKQLEEIHNFKQKGDEILYQAWERPNKTPSQALDAIQTMANHSHKWHNGSTSMRVSSNSSEGIAAITNKLDSLGRDMKKLKENVHAIQVRCEKCGGAQLNEEVKSVEEFKYGEFGRPFPNNNGNGARYRVGLPGYYTRVDNRSPFGKKKPILEELMSKHLEESTRRRTEMKEWMQKLHESTNLNTRNQNASLKNLETHIE
ncbi:hypothetical protein Tco_0910584 [Tanacetum coccineum]|uniref:Retrotransposon gag domain-containing protein n=1 Tax=Tanacetum coccineum TaxID=301880 RepID=A0ABQ5D0F8_9ASTR